jgi:hypothetical protein
MAVGKHTLTVKAFLVNYSTALFGATVFTLQVEEAKFYSLIDKESLTYFIGEANVPFDLKELYSV